jgi:hypothetical protein
VVRDLPLTRIRSFMDDHKEASLPMAERNPRDRAQRGSASPAAEDRKLQRAVLAYVLDRHPAHLTFVELGREITSEDAEHDEADPFARAVRDLVLAGLLECPSAHVVPTRAALYFDALESD